MRPLQRRRADDLSPEEFRTDYLATRTPVIITGAMDHLAAATRWRRDALATVGHLPVAVARDELVTRTDAVVPLATFLAELGREDARWCYAFQDISTDPVRYGWLWEAFEVPRFVGALDRDACVVSRFYVGAARYGAVPHSHSETINLLAEGSKAWMLYPSDAAGHARTHAYSAEHYGTGGHARWFAETSAETSADGGWTGVQQAGEILFVPRDVFHTTCNAAHTIGATWRWDDRTAPLSPREPRSAIDVDGVSIARVGTARVPGAIFAWFGDALSGPVALEVVPVEVQRAMVLVVNLAARFPAGVAKWFPDPARLVRVGFTIVVGAGGDLRIDGTPVGDGLRPLLLDAIFGASCFNETIRCGLIAR